MKKLNRLYLSPLDIFKPGRNLPRSYSFYGNNHYHDGNPAEDIETLFYYEPLTSVLIRYPKSKFQFMGALNPFSKMGKDFSDTFRPYYSSGKVKRDLLQPIRGLLNIGKGLFSLGTGLLGSVGLGLILPVRALGIFFYHGDDRTLYLKERLHEFTFSSSWMLEGAGNIIRGALQVLTTPLTYLFKMPLRGILTGLQKTPIYVEDKPEIKRLAIKANEKLNHLVEEDYKTKEYLTGTIDKFKDEIDEIDAVLYEINRKCDKSIKDGWKAKPSLKSALSSYQNFSTFFRNITQLSAEKFKEQQQSMELPNDMKDEVQSYLNHFNKPR